MSYGQRPYAGASYGGGNPAGAGGGNVIVDPSRPDLPGYRWLTQTAPGPYGATAYAGGGVVDRPAVGGIRVVADAGTGVVRLDAWWVNADYLRIMRVLPDGTRQPVRGAYPMIVPNGARSRTNLCTNPSFEVDTSGHLAGANTTISRVVGATLHGDAHGRLTATAAGAVTETIPTLLPTDIPFAVQLALRLSAAPTGALTVTGSWQDQTGAAIGTSVATLSAAQLAAYVNRWDRIPALTLTPPAPTTVTIGSGTTATQEQRYPVQGTLTLSIAGMAAGARADVDGILIEAGADAPRGGYFDGGDTYAQWAGTAHASTSSLASPVSVVDSELPLDVPVRYELAAPSQPQYRVVSEPVTLPSGNRCWLTNPLTGLTMVVGIEKEPDQTLPIERAVYRIPGRRNAVAISAAQRGSPEGTYAVATRNNGDKARLLDMLDDGSPLLLRMPANHGHGPGEWISIAHVTITSPFNSAREGTRHLSLPYVVVDGPALDGTLVA